MVVKFKGVSNIFIGKIVLAVLLVVVFFSPITDLVSFTIELILSIVLIITAPKMKTSYIVFASLILVLATISYLSNHSPNGIGDYFAPIFHWRKYFYILISVVVCEYFTMLNREEKKRFFLLICGCISITNLISLYHVSRDPLAIRYRSLRGDFWGIIKFQHIFAFAILAIIIVLFYIYKGQRKEKSNYNLMVLGTLAIIVIMLFLSQLATPGLLAILVCVSIAVIAFSKGKLLTRVSIVLAITVCLILWREILDFVLNLFFSDTNNSFVALRIEAIFNFLLGDGGQTTSLMNRSAKINISLNSFQQSPIMGIGFSNFNMNTVGCHQDWFDILAVFGLVGLTVVCVFFISYTIQKMRSLNERIDKIAFAAAVVYFFLLGFLDPCLELSILIVVFGIAPNISCLIDEKGIQISA